MENQEYINKLEKCRNNIDSIDDKILQLLQDRIAQVEEVRKIKLENGEKFFIKSAREADMIKNLLEKAEEKLSKSALVSIWRKIITSSNILEQPIKIALHNPLKITDFKYILREYYADFVPIINHENISDVVLDIQKNNAQIAVFTLPKNDSDICDNWWINLANNKDGLKVFARLPFLKSDEYNLVVLAKKEQEKSSSDISLLCVEANKNTSKSQIIADMDKLGSKAQF